VRELLTRLKVLNASTLPGSADVACADGMGGTRRGNTLNQGLHIVRDELSCRQKASDLSALSSLVRNRFRAHHVILSF
jgi:hypothetical protein